MMPMRPDQPYRRRRRVALAATAILILALIVIALAAARPAKAENPYDPYIPIPALGWCPGGGFGGAGWGGYCEGQTYADGTRWSMNTVLGYSQPMQCIVFTGQPMPPLAPPSGCGRGAAVLR